MTLSINAAKSNPVAFLYYRVSIPLTWTAHAWGRPRLGTPTSRDTICTAWLGGAAALTLVLITICYETVWEFSTFQVLVLSFWLIFSSPLSFCILKQAVRMNIVSSYIYFKTSFLRYPIISLTSSTLQKTWVVGQVLCQFIKKDYFSSDFPICTPFPCAIPLELALTSQFLARTSQIFHFYQLLSYVTSISCLGICYNNPLLPLSAWAATTKHRLGNLNVFSHKSWKSKWGCQSYGGKRAPFLACRSLLMSVMWWRDQTLP